MSGYVCTPTRKPAYVHILYIVKHILQCKYAFIIMSYVGNLIVKMNDDFQSLLFSAKESVNLSK